jgi:hypothetical protein
MNRRNFMKSILAAAAAPALVKYGSLMVPNSYIDGEPKLIRVQNVIPVNPVLRIYTGPAPNVNGWLGEKNKLLASMSLSPEIAAQGGSVRMRGQDDYAQASGTASFFRMYDSRGMTLMQGDISGPGGGGDMTFDCTAISAGSTVCITNFNLSSPRGFVIA